MKKTIGYDDMKDNFKLEMTTVWSFPKRGNWATHSGMYRGNWSPYVPRNLILKFTKCERKAPKFIYGDISSLKNNDSISLFFIVLYF